MAHLDDLLRPVGREDRFLGNTIVFRHGADHIAYRDSAGLDSDDMAYHLLRQSQVYLAVRKRGVRQKRSQNTLQIPHRIADVLGNKIYHLIAERNTVTTHFGEQDILAQNIIRFLDLRRETPFETGQQTLLNILQFYRRTIGRQNQLFTALLQIIEDMKERILRSTGGRSQVKISCLRLCWR